MAAAGKWRRTAGLVFTAAALLFLTYFVVRNAAELRAHEWSVRPGLLAVSLLLNIAGLAWGVNVWKMVLRRMGRRVDYLGLARVWFVSGLGRYIPGKIWQFVGAAHLGSAAGLEPAATVTSLAVHTGFFLIGAILTALYLVPVGTTDLGGATVDLLWRLAPLLLLLGHPSVIKSCLHVVRRATGRSIAAWTGSWLQGVWLIFLAGIGWTLTGVALYLFILSLTPLPFSVVGEIVGINALAFVIGYLVFIAPAGLGAKESALTVLLSVYVPLPVAALLAIAARLWTVAAEVIPALLLLHRAAVRPPPDQDEASGREPVKM